MNPIVFVYVWDAAQLGLTDRLFGRVHVRAGISNPASYKDVPITAL